MLNFQTETIINANKDIDSGKVLYAADGTTLRIKRDFVFEKDNVKKIYKKLGYEPVLCKATINFADTDLLAALNTDGGYFRLDLYVGIEGAEPYIYSTPYAYKGMPLWVEFSVKKGAAAADIAKSIADAIKKNHLFQQDKDLLAVTVSGDTLVLEGASEYQRLNKVAINKFADETEETVAVLGDAAITLNERGKNGFGTYSHIVKDLRLPTYEHNRWAHLLQAETPIVGAVYNQYIVEYKADAADGSNCIVGDRPLSHTTHVFWVKNDLTDWDTAIAAIGTPEVVA